MNCILTGHRSLPDDPLPLARALLRELERQYADGCTHFFCGGAEGFDLLAAEVVLALRAQYPDIRLTLLLPFEGHDRGFSPADRRRMADVMAQADGVQALSPVYYDGCFFARDRALADCADRCICWMIRGRSGTGVTVRRCLTRDVPVVNLADALR